MSTLQTRFEACHIRVPCSAMIRNNATGEIRSTPTDLWVPNGSTEDPDCFIWRDGNYSCDCNRRVFFDRVNGIESLHTAKCGNGAYSVCITRQDNQRIIYAEF